MEYCVLRYINIIVTNSNIMSKRQFLDPIGACSRIILLHFSDPGTKLRIDDHRLQLVHDTWWEKIVGRKYYQDSKDDMCVLFSIIVRYIELYLLPNKKNPQKQSSFLKRNLSSSDISETENTYINCYDDLKKLAEYMQLGITDLQKTYGFNNAVFTLQYFNNLLSEAMNSNYNAELLLPVHLQKHTNYNLLDVSKIKKLWTDTDIIILRKHFTACFDARLNMDIRNLNASKTAIISILDSHDEEFKNMISLTEGA
jgi:hypothetical protein